MTKRIKAKKKLERRYGAPILGNGRTLTKRNFKPGQHGPSSRGGKLSGYGEQLRELKKFAWHYGGLLRKQFKRIYEEAIRRRGDSSENLVEILERRLTTVVYRAKFAPSIFAARQIVNHGHILVNGQRVNIGSYQLRDGDVISLSSKAQNMPIVLEAIKDGSRDIPSYMEVDLNKMTAKFMFAPKFADVPYPAEMKPNLIVEFFAR